MDIDNEFVEKETNNIDNIEEVPVTSPVCETVPEPANNPDAAPAYAPAIAQEPEKKKKSGGFLKTALLCLLCGIIGGAVVFGAGKLFTKQEKNNPEPSYTVVPQGEVVINVKDVSSPATAVAIKVLPSIVGIRVTFTTEVSSWFFGTTEQQGSSEGSGIIYTEDGYIITNYHVIGDALNNAGELSNKATLSVFLPSAPETAVDASIIGYDISSDLAVLKVNKTGLKAIELGDSSKVAQGDIAIAVGNPGGLEFMGSISQGIISGLNRTITVESSTYKDVALIQTDAAINPGNSGGALVDVGGKLIGVNSVKLVSSGYEGMGFAIPVNYVVDTVDKIISNPNSSVVYLGIEENTSYTADLLEKNGYPGGIVVKSVASGSPAANAGIEEYDIIVSFNGETVRTMADLNEAKLKCDQGDTVVIRVYRAERRSGKYIEFNVTLA